jgi:hypothetical protein
MLKLIALSVLLPLGIVLGVLALVALPFLLIGLLFKVLILAIVLPFRVLGFAIGTVGALLAGLGKVLLFLATVALMVLLAGGALLAVPLVPLLLIGLGIWLVARMLRARPSGYAAQVPHGTHG